jgi:hypothetical protein
MNPFLGRLAENPEHLFVSTGATMGIIALHKTKKKETVTLKSCVPSKTSNSVLNVYMWGEAVSMTL